MLCMFRRHASALHCMQLNEPVELPCCAQHAPQTTRAAPCGRTRAVLARRIWDQLRYMPPLGICTNSCHMRQQAWHRRCKTYAHASQPSGVGRRMSRRAADTQRQEGCDANESSHRLAQIHSLHLILCAQARKLQQILPPIESTQAQAIRCRWPCIWSPLHLGNTA